MLKIIDQRLINFSISNKLKKTLLSNLELKPDVLLQPNTKWNLKLPKIDHLFSSNGSNSRQEVHQVLIGLYIPFLLLRFKKRKDLIRIMMAIIKTMVTIVTFQTCCRRFCRRLIPNSRRRMQKNRGKRPERRRSCRERRRRKRRRGELQSRET